MARALLEVAQLHLTRTIAHRVTWDTIEGDLIPHKKGSHLLEGVDEGQMRLTPCLNVLSIRDANRAFTVDLAKSDLPNVSTFVWPGV